MVNNVKVIPEYKTASAAALLKKKFKLKTTHTHTDEDTLTFDKFTPTHTNYPSKYSVVKNFPKRSCHFIQYLH